MSESNPQLAGVRRANRQSNSVMRPANPSDLGQGREVASTRSSPHPNPLRGTDPLSHIFRHQYDQLVRFCRARISNPSDAEDLVQDAFLSIRRAYADKPDEDLRALLFTTVRNLSVNYLKSGRIRQARQSDEIGELGDRRSNRSWTPKDSLSPNARSPP